jgi:hypothetical protein
VWKVEESCVLIPVYIVGFILGGLLCFAIAQRVSNRPVKICLRTIGVVAGPIFFLVVAIFSSQEREKPTKWNGLRESGQRSITAMSTRVVKILERLEMAWLRI